MKLITQVLFKFMSPLKPCRNILRVFKFKKTLSIKAFRFSNHHSESKTSHPNKLANKLRRLFKSPKKSREMDRLMTLGSFSESGYEKVPFPSPITPAYLRTRAAYDHEEISVNKVVDEACESFEKFLVEMIVEERKVDHLVDVEEFLYNWNNLKCPVFIDMVCRFYGELCKDFVSNKDENMGTPSMPKVVRVNNSTI